MGNDSGGNRSYPELQEWQLSEVRSYLQFARDHSPFYQDRMADVDVSAIRSLSDFRSEVGVTVKEDVIADQRENEPYGRRLTVSESEIHKVHLTSGTSGRGREVWAASVRDQGAAIDQLSEGFDRIGLTSADTVFNTLPIGTSAAGDWLSKGFERLGANVFNVGPYSTKRKVELMDRFSATAVFATPSYLDRLQSTADDIGIDLTAQTIMTATDSLPESQVEEIERQWDGTLYEEYGVTEGSSLWTCGRGVIDEDGRGTIHFEQEHCLYEVVDPEDRSTPVASGEFGELVVTPFAVRRAMPLVRFATGDRVRYVGPNECSCGLTLDGIESGTIARYDDMLKIRGVNVWPQTVDELIFDVEGVRKYRGIVTQDETGRERAIVEIEWYPTDASDERREERKRSLENRIADEVGLQFDVRDADGELPDYSSAENKPDRWTDDRYT